MGWPLAVILPQEASYHMPTIHRRTTTLLASAVALAGGCTPRVSPLPVPDPTLPPSPISSTPGVLTYRFSPDTYRYRFQQTADIRSDGPGDTIPSTITTRGIFLVRVTTEVDSSISILVSVDSISIASQGSVPARGLQQVLALDTVMVARFSRSSAITTSRLADSLCAYGHFATTARELLLPELGIELTTPTQEIYKDTVTQHSCRAGVALALATTRQVRDLNRSPTEFTVEQHTEIRGAGMLRRDSIIVTGSVTTRGAVQFGTGSRLLSLSRTRSEGTITVRLGSTITTFRQTSTQELKLEPFTPP